MLRLFILIIVLGFSGSGRAQASSPAPAGGSLDLCVLVYERAPHPVAQAARSFYEKIPNSRLVIEAKPLDFISCIDDGAREILMIAHGFWRSDSTSPQGFFQLGYFVPAPPDDQGQPRWEPKIFLNRTFEIAYEKLNDERRRTGQNRLQKIRFAACGIESLRETHPMLTKLIRDFVTDYEEAPKASKLAIWISGASKVPGVKRAVDEEWLSQSARCEKAVTWKTEANGRCQADWWAGCDRRQARVCRGLSF